MTRIYRFGEDVTLEGNLTGEQMAAILAEAQERRAVIQDLPLSRILDTLDAAADLWADPEYHGRVEAMRVLPGFIRFSPEMVEQGIMTMVDLLRRENMQTRLACDLGDARCLDGMAYHSRFNGYIGAQPLGALAHVSAGNVFVGGVDSLIQGLVTKNVNIMKMSRNDPVFPILFAQSLRELDGGGPLSSSLALLHWKGGTDAVESVLKQEADAIVVYGGAETVNSYRAGLGLHTKLIEYGPKYSFVLAEEREMRERGLEECARRIARDATMWEQSACSSPHAVYVERGAAHELAGAIARQLTLWAEELPPGELLVNEAVEINKVREMAKVEEAMGVAELFQPSDTGWTVVLTEDTQFTTSCQHRTLYVKPVDTLEDALEAVRPMGKYLQTVSIVASRERTLSLAESLQRIGADRMVEIGQQAVRKHGSPHDGTRGLAELVRWTSLAAATPVHGEGFAGDDPKWSRWTRADDGFDFLPVEDRDRITLQRLRDVANFARQNVPYYRDAWPDITIETLEDFRSLPLLTGEDLKAQVPPRGEGLLSTNEVTPGIVFCSGGSTGLPKSMFRTTEEQHVNAWHLGKGLALSVFGPGDVVGNLLFAGSMWASFVSFNMALEHTGARILPLAGNMDTETTLSFLQIFKANAAITVPSVLLSLGEEVERRGLVGKVVIEKVATGGEHLFEGGKDYLRRVLGVRKFASTGYAANETGAIAYQCEHCDGATHHVHEDLHFMEILDPDTLKPVPTGVPGRVVLTNLQRRLMPTVRYDIGDMGRWLEEPCPCGRTIRRMELLGRTDDVLIIGGGNILPEVVDRIVHEFPELSQHFQMIARLDGYKDQLLVKVEGLESRPEGLDRRIKERLYEESRELRVMYEKGLIADMAVEVVEPGGIKRNPRTGKISLTVDERS